MAAEDGISSWTAVEEDGRAMAKRGDLGMFGWQAKPLEKPAGGEKFRGSAFLHPLRTPSGFEWTQIQPSDHLHHFGLWWPWKFIELGGEKFNTWEIQEGQGAHEARQVKFSRGDAGSMRWDLTNETVVKKPGEEARTAIIEKARLVLSMSGEDAVALDISLDQLAPGQAVTISDYRYSGFSWRGPASWNQQNSKMVTSEGKGRDDANGHPARWVFVTGPTPGGAATVLMMSAASELAGTPEKLRVWDSKAHNGAPFVNFNPVMEKPLPLDEKHPAVSKRNYRVIAADRTIDAAGAEAEWRKWLGK